MKPASISKALIPTLAALILPITPATAQTTGTLTVAGADVPSTDIIASNESDLGGLGTRPLQWNGETTHSLVGQSFLVPTEGGNTTLNAIYLNLSFYFPKFASFSQPTFSLKIFEGDDTTHNDPIATFSYSSAALGDNTVPSSNWLRFGLDGGVSVTAGQTYSFLMVFESFDVDNYISFRRGKNDDGYTDGAELRAGNSYAIGEWATNPWNPAGADNERPRPLGGDLWFYLGGPADSPPPPPAAPKVDEITYDSGTDEVSLWWAAEAGATYTVAYSSDLAGFSRFVALAVPDNQTQPFTFTSPAPASPKLFFKVSRNP